MHAHTRIPPSPKYWPCCCRCCHSWQNRRCWLGGCCGTRWWILIGWCVIFVLRWSVTRVVHATILCSCWKPCGDGGGWWNGGGWGSSWDYGGGDCLVLKTNQRRNLLLDVITILQTTLLFWSFSIHWCVLFYGMDLFISHYLVGNTKLKICVTVCFEIHVRR